MKKIYTAVRVVSWKNGGIISISALGSNADLCVVNQIIRKQYLDEQDRAKVVYNSEHCLNVDDGLCATIETNSAAYEGEHILINYETVVNYLGTPDDIKEVKTTPRNLTLNSSVEELASSFDKRNAMRIYNILYYRMRYKDVLDILIGLKKGQKIVRLGASFVNAIVKIVNDVYYEVGETEFEQQCKKRLESKY
jgi:hypothetical protein